MGKVVDHNGHHALDAQKLHDNQERLVMPEAVQ
jgi:hypothetical protein